MAAMPYHEITELERYGRGRGPAMVRQVWRYVMLVALGLAVGAGMQVFPHLPGQWGENVVTYMAGDLGCWAVIAVVIATYAPGMLHAGGRCFAFMAGMMAGYYLLYPVSAAWNLHWFALMVLMFPIGMVVYWYRDKLWAFVAMEIAMAGFLAYDAFFLVNKIMRDEIIVYNELGESVIGHETAFTLGNYVLLPLAVIWCMWFMWRRRRDRVRALATGRPDGA